MPSPVVEYFEGGLAPESDELVAAVHALMAHADSKRRLGVWANADNGPTARGPPVRRRRRRSGPDRAHVPR